MTRVEIAHDPAQETPPGKPRAESARVIVTDTSGARREAFVPYVPGYPSHPMDRAQVEAKAAELMQPALGPQRTREVIARCRDLEALKRADALVRLIAA